MLHLQKLTVMYPAEEPKIKQLAQFIAAVFQVAFLLLYAIITAPRKK